VQNVIPQKEGLCMLTRRNFVKVALGSMAALPMVGCSSQAASDSGTTSDGGSSSDRIATVNWNAGTSGNVLLTIANAKGYFDEAGIKINMVQANANSDALTMLSTGKTDVVSNAGTAAPLQQIAAGQDFTIFGGHMLTGCMPIIAKKGTTWNGVQDFIGKKVAANPSYFALTGAVMNLGYDDPLTAVDWQTYTDYTEAMAAVVRGDADYALMGTGQVQAVKNSQDVDIMCYQSDIMADYSCCRMECQGSWLEENKETAQKLLVVLLRAQAYYEANKEEAVSLHAEATDTDDDYVSAFMLDDHYQVNVDPLRASVNRAWNILDETDFLDEKAKQMDINDHINTELYRSALDEAKQSYGDDYADFFTKMESFYTEQNIDTQTTQPASSCCV
jgi:NitT/TauT family transport system substrate-binding protein